MELRRQGAIEAFRPLHDAFAAYLWRCYKWQQMGRAALHWVRGSDVPSYAEALRQCSSSAAPGEQDLFVARAVLQTLACSSAGSRDGQVAHAHALLQALKGMGAAPDTPLTHALGFILHAASTRSHQLYAAIQQQYKPSLDRDPSFAAYLKRIEEVVFGVRRSNGLADFLRSI